MPPAWNKLSYETLLLIFEYVGRSNTSWFKRTALCECLHVCKDWSRPAQAVLYRNVNLDNGTLGPGNLRLFLKTITNSTTNLGTQVQKITLCNYIQYAGDPVDNLKLLFRYCPNIEELYSPGETVDVVRPNLLSEEKSRLPKLKAILKDNESAVSFVYPFLADKFKDSLVTLHLEMDRFRMPRPHTQWMSDQLVKCISDYSSLTALNFGNCRISYDCLNHIIDLCGTAVAKITFQHRMLVYPGSSYDTTTLNPNYGIKEIWASGTMYDSITYIASKFRGLETLKIKQISDCDEEDITRLKDLCTLVKRYDLGFESNITRDTIKQCINLAASMNMSNRQILIQFGSDKGTQLKKFGNISKIEVHVPEKEDTSNDCTDWLKGSFFTSIEVKGITTIKGLDERDEERHYDDYEHLHIAENSACSFTDIFKKYAAYHLSNSKN